jgi:hypothetical protein
MKKLIIGTLLLLLSPSCLSWQTYGTVAATQTGVENAAGWWATRHHLYNYTVSCQLTDIFEANCDVLSGGKEYPLVCSLSVVGERCTLR